MLQWYQNERVLFCCEVNMAYVKYNPNPDGKNVGDCVIRAISKATGKSWEDVYTGVCLTGYSMCDMPSANCVWGAYLRHNGFMREIVPNECPECYNVSDFAREHPRGTYILALTGHVVCVQDGDWYDSWDSGDKIPMYYWEKRR